METPMLLEDEIKCTKCNTPLDKCNFKPRKVMVKKCNLCNKRSLKDPSLPLADTRSPLAKEAKDRKGKKTKKDLETEIGELKNHIKYLETELDNKTI